MVKGFLLILIGTGVAVGVTRTAIGYIILGTTAAENIFTYGIPFFIMLSGFIMIFMLLKHKRRNY